MNTEEIEGNFNHMCFAQHIPNVILLIMLDLKGKVLQFLLKEDKRESPIQPQPRNSRNEVECIKHKAEEAGRRASEKKYKPSKVNSNEKKEAAKQIGKEIENETVKAIENIQEMMSKSKELRAK